MAADEEETANTPSGESGVSMKPWLSVHGYTQTVVRVKGGDVNRDTSVYQRAVHVVWFWWRRQLSWSVR